MTTTLEKIKESENDLIDYKRTLDDAEKQVIAEQKYVEQRKEDVKREEFRLESLQANFIDEHEEQLQTYFMEEERDLVGTKDQCEDNFERWLEGLDFEEIKDIIFGRKGNKKSDRDEYDNQVKFS